MKLDSLANPTIAEVSLAKLKASLISWFQKAQSLEPELTDWTEIEPEVIAGELATGLNLDEDQMQRLVIKIILLAKLHNSDDAPEFDDVFYDIPLICKLVEVVNNVDIHLDQPERVPHVTSLELAWFIDELVRVANLKGDSLKSLSPDLKKVCAYQLHEEGYYKPVGVFSSFLRTEDLHRYWYEQDVPKWEPEMQAILEDKAKGLEVYVNMMRSRLC